MKFRPTMDDALIAIYQYDHLVNFYRVLRDRFPQLFEENRLGDLFGPTFRNLPNNSGDSHDYRSIYTQILSNLNKFGFDLNKVIQLYLIDPNTIPGNLLYLIDKYESYKFAIDHIISNPVLNKLPTGNYGVNPDNILVVRHGIRFHEDDYKYVISHNNGVVRTMQMENIVTICSNLSKYMRLFIMNRMSDQFNVKDNIKSAFDTLLKYIEDINTVIPTPMIESKLVIHPYSPVERAIENDLRDRSTQIPTKLPIDLLYMIMERVSPFDIYSVGEFVPVDTKMVTDFVKYFCPILNINYDKLNEFIRYIIRENSESGIIGILHYLNFSEQDFNYPEYESVLIDSKQRQIYRNEIEAKLRSGVDKDIIRHEANMHLLNVSLILVLAASVHSIRLTEDEKKTLNTDCNYAENSFISLFARKVFNNGYLSQDLHLDSEDQLHLNIYNKRNGEMIFYMSNDEIGRNLIMLDLFNTFTINVGQLISMGLPYRLSDRKIAKTNTFLAMYTMEEFNYGLNAIILDINRNPYPRFDIVEVVKRLRISDVNYPGFKFQQKLSVIFDNISMMIILELIMKSNKSVNHYNMITNLRSAVNKLFDLM